MDYQILKDELINDPLTIGYASMTTSQKADALNGLTQDVPTSRVVSVASLKLYCMQKPIVTTTGQTTLWLLVKRYGESMIVPHEQLWDLFHDSDVQNIDFMPGNLQNQMLQVGLSVLLADADVTFDSNDVTTTMNDVLALARKTSRAEILGLGLVHGWDIERAEAL
jgi:hypothetical protein